MSMVKIRSLINEYIPGALTSLLGIVFVAFGGSYIAKLGRTYDKSLMLQLFCLVVTLALVIVWIYFYLYFWVGIAKIFSASDMKVSHLFIIRKGNSPLTRKPHPVDGRPLGKGRVRQYVTPNLTGAVIKKLKRQSRKRVSH